MNPPAGDRAADADGSAVVSGFNSGKGNDNDVGCTGCDRTYGIGRRADPADAQAAGAGSGAVGRSRCYWAARGEVAVASLDDQAALTRHCKAHRASISWCRRTMVQRHGWPSNGRRKTRPQRP